MNTRIFLLLPSLFPTSLAQTKSPYIPTWESLDSRPLPEWYDNAKVGIFIHTGVYSVPGFISEWFWAYWKRPNQIKQSVVDFMAQNYPPGFTYQDFGSQFTYEFFNATQWIELFERAGAKYAVLTTKHHDGFTLWPSKYSYSWNSVDVGPKRDIVAEFTGAVRRSSSLHLGLYHSLYEWFNPLYMEDKANNFTTRNYPPAKGTAELYELVQRYSPDLLWSDGDAGPPEYWKSKEFLAWLYNQSNVKDKVVVNDRWGYGTSCKHGGYWNCADRYNPGTSQPHKWENAMTLDKKSWGYRRNSELKDYLTIEELVKTLTKTMSNGGNILINVGPTKEGTIPVIMEERLIQLGAWLSVNGESVYNSVPWLVHNDTLARDVWYVANRGGDVYATVLGKGREQLQLAGIARHMAGDTEVVVVGTGAKCFWEMGRGVVRVHVGGDPANSLNAGLGYVLRFNKVNIKKRV